MPVLLPIPPANTPFFDPQSKQVNLVWQNYLQAIQDFIAAIGGAPADAQYWVSTANGDLTNERDLGALTTGYVKVTTTLGVAVPSTVASIPAADVTFPTWSTVVYNAANFTGNSLMTWTVGALDQTAFAYVAFGKTVTITVKVVDSTVGGTPDTTLQIALPNSYVATVAQEWPFTFSDDGIGGIGTASVAASGTVLRLQKANGTAWNASTNNTDIGLTVQVQVN